MKSVVSLNCSPAMLTLLVLIVIMCTDRGQAVPTLVMHREARNNRQACGLALVELMSLVCGGNYASPGKRSSASTGLFDRIAKEPKFGQQPGDWQESNLANPGDELIGDEPGQDLMDIGLNVFNTKRSSTPPNDQDVFYRNVRGIVEECCHKPCSMSTLRQYCGNSKRSMIP